MTQVPDLASLIPPDWLQQQQEQYLQLLEKITFTLVRVAAAQEKWIHPLESASEYESFFQAEAARLGKSLAEIKGFFHQAASIKAKEQVFEQHYGELIPRGETKQPLIPRAVIAAFVRQAVL